VRGDEISLRAVLNVSVLILGAKSNRMKDLLPLMPACSEALLSTGPGQVVEVGPF
jgi:hypothetical protein